MKRFFYPFPFHIVFPSTVQYTLSRLAIPFSMFSFLFFVRSHLHTTHHYIIFFCSVQYAPYILLNSCVSFLSISFLLFVLSFTTSPFFHFASAILFLRVLTYINQYHLLCFLRFCLCFVFFFFCSQIHFTAHNFILLYLILRCLCVGWCMVVFVSLQVYTFFSFRLLLTLFPSSKHKSRDKSPVLVVLFCFVSVCVCVCEFVVLRTNEKRGKTFSKNICPFYLFSNA